MGNKYLRNLTLSIIGQLHIDKDELFDGSSMGAQALYRSRRTDITDLLKKMRPETLGRIVSCGRGFGNGFDGRKTPLYEVHLGSYLDKYADGKSLLLELACTAIVAEMTDIFRNQLSDEFHAGGHEGVLQG